MTDMTATTTRQLMLVTDDFIPPKPSAAPVRETVVPAGRATHLTDAYEAAQRACMVGDVQTDQDSDIALLMEMLAAPGADVRDLLRQYGDARYIHGYVDSANSVEADWVVAEIHSLDARRAMRGGDDAG